MWKTSLNSHTLGRRLVTATLVFSIVFTLSAVAVRTWMAWQSNVAAMATELALIDTVFARALSKSIWDVDREELQRDVKAVSQVSGVGAVELKILMAGRPPEILAYRGTPGQGAGSVPVLHHKLTFEAYPGSVEEVGELSLEGDERILWGRLKDELATIVVTQVIQSLLLAALIMSLFNRMVTVHVRAIAAHLARLTPDTMRQLLHLRRAPRRKDELSALVGGINDLQSNLLGYFTKQRAAENDLAAHRDRLAELVEEQTAELRAANVRLEELTRSDPLTTLANRRHFDEVKETEFWRSKRLGLPLSVLICDIDFFKRYNDTYGHAFGDRCLQMVAQTMRQAFARAGDLPARIGGEEFAVLLPAADLASARSAAARLQQLLTARAIEHSASEVAPHVTLSVGAAQLDHATMQCFDDLLQKADEALYRAKAQGRNRVAI